MDPERLQRLLARIRDLRSEGVSDREINSALRRKRDLPINSVRVALTEGEAAGFVGPDQTILVGGDEDEEGDNPLQAAVPALQGFSGSFASDIIEGLEKVGVAREGASERFRGQLEEERQENPIQSTVGQVGGFLASPAAKLGGALIGGGARAGGALLAPAGRVAGRAAGRAIGSGSGGIGALAGQGTARAVGATAGGAAGGAAEGALIDIGEAAGEEDRIGTVGGAGTLLGGAIGAVTGGVGSSIRSAQGINRAKAQRGEVLADAADRVGRGLPSARQVSGRLEEAEGLMKNAFAAAEDAGREIPGEVTDLLTSSPQARSAIRNAANRGSPEAREFLQELDRFEQGARESVPAASFELADDVRKQLKFEEDVFARQAQSGTGAAPASQGAQREAQRVRGLLESSLEEVPEFRTAVGQAAEMGTQARAFSTGIRNFDKPAEVLEELATKGKTRFGEETITLAGGSEASAAFRSGLAQPVLKKLRGGSASAENFITKIQDSSELQRKMKIILGGDTQFKRFMTEADRLRDLGNASKLAETLVKMAGFLGAGSSLAGGAAVTGLLGGS